MLESSNYASAPLKNYRVKDGVRSGARGCNSTSTELERLETFRTWRHGNDPAPLTLVRCGFYYTLKEDEVECCDCLMKVKNWAEKSHPYIEHYKTNKRCVFVQKFKDKVSSFRLTDFTSTSISKFGDISNRISSFATKEHLFVNQSKAALSNAGFSYKGHGDKVICFECEIQLKQWVSCDIPICEHSKWSPYCPYVKVFLTKLDSILGLDTSGLARQSRPNESPDWGLGYFQQATGNHFDSPNHQHELHTPTSSQIQEIIRQQSIFDLTKPTDRSSTNNSPHGGLGYLQQATGNHFNSPHHQHRHRSPTSSQYQDTNRGQSSFDSTQIQDIERGQSSFDGTQIQDIKRPPSIFDHTKPTDRTSTPASGTLDEETKGLPIIDQIEIVVSMDFDRKLVEKIAREHFDKTGKGFAHAEELCAAVLDAQEDSSYHLKQSTEWETTERSREKNHREKVDKSGVPDEGLGVSIDYVDDTNNSECNSQVLPPSNTHTYDDEGIGNSLSYQSQQTHEREDVIVCKICLSDPVEVTFLPCGHLLTCNVCSVRVEACPICRCTIRGRVKTYLP